MDHTQDLNLNSVKCIQSAAKFGETVYYNICNSSHTSVPWGSMDYVGCFALIGIGLFILAMLSAMIYLMVFEI